MAITYTVVWEELTSASRYWNGHTAPDELKLLRLKVPEGWLVRIGFNYGPQQLLYVPDPGHAWLADTTPEQ